MKHQNQAKPRSDYEPIMDFMEEYIDDLHQQLDVGIDRHKMEIRRAIESRQERLRLQKEIDYLFDEDFSKEDEE